MEWWSRARLHECVSNSPQRMRSFLPQCTLKRFCFFKLLFYLVLTDLSHFIPSLPFSSSVSQYHFGGVRSYSSTVLVLLLPLLFRMPDTVLCPLSTAIFAHYLVPTLMTFLCFAMQIVMVALILLFMLCVLFMPTQINSSTYTF